jgi:Holliday junction resolvasome RuvABC endonuclease subunit
MYNAVIGIDPGKAGGLAIIHKNGHVRIMPMPLAGESIDASAIHDWIDEFLIYDHHKLPSAWVEKVHAMPGQGVSSMFKFGYTVGIIHGIITTMGIPLYLVAPQTWKKSVLMDMAKVDKSASAEFCRRVYPDVSLLATPRSRKFHSGMADALCIAHYGYERLNAKK